MVPRWCACSGRLGRVAEGGLADLLVVEGDPLADLCVLPNQGAQIAMIVKDGAFVKDKLS
jgi:imidazolonepropionase-like amidohydrolase